MAAFGQEKDLGLFSGVEEGEVMLVTVIAIICNIAGESCMEKMVTNSELGDVTMQACLMGQPQLAKWMEQHPGYRLKSWRCILGELPKKEDI